MPTYEYACSACGHKFEEFQSINAKPTVKCPACGKHKVKRLISAGAGFIFKGSGFYITDYRSDKYKADAKGDTAASPANGAANSDAPKSETSVKTETAKTDSTPAKAESKAPAKAESKSESKPAAKPRK